MTRRERVLAVERAPCKVAESSRNRNPHPRPAPADLADNAAGLLGGTRRSVDVGAPQIVLDVIGGAPVGEASGEALGQPDRPIGRSEQQCARIREVVVPPSEPATTRPETSPNSNFSALHSVRIGEFLQIAKALFLKSAFADSEPRCTYPS